ncbi:MAG TPA: carboxypeptidase regulatory-like domain-containing protein [Gemmatimonadaceae bacterium]|nr:carboxypeptidase regulatory-like domain-containing protein [Gemmatimonadaceae bacterium]
MKRLRPLFTLAALAVLAACGDTRPTTSPHSIPSNRDISDGANNGNPHFFFLPPMVKNPFGSLGLTAGTFSPSIATRVEICQFDGTSCGPTIRTFQPSDITVSPSSASYTVNWDTKADNVLAGLTYRIRVLVTVGTQTVELGYADVLAVANMAEFKNMQTSDLIGLVDGRTLPIAYRVDLGAMSYALGQAGLPGGCTNTSDCAEAIIGNNSPTGSYVVTTNTGFAGGEFFNGWLPGDFANQQVLVTIQRENVLASGPCHAEPFPQFEGCYHFQTTPFVGNFALPVTVGMCVTVPETSPLYHHLELFSSRPATDNIPAEPLTVLDDAAPSFLPSSKCEGFGPSVAPSDTRIGATPSGVLHLAELGLRNLGSSLATLFGPRPLYAIHLGLGGMADSFSNIDWGIASDLSIAGGDGQSGPPGSTLAVPLSVHAATAHNDEVAASEVQGVGVTFTITSEGGGSLTAGDLSGPSVTVRTDASGNASVSLTLPPNGGTVTVVASAPAVANAPETTQQQVTFTEQGNTLGSITGTVRDASGAVLPGVTVSAVNSVTQASVSAVTDATGHYVIVGLAAGTYSVVAGFPNYIFTNPTATVNGDTVTVDITGSPASGIVG